MRRRFTIVQIFRKAPASVLIVGAIIVVLCPIALLHYSANDQSPGNLFMKNAALPLKSSRAAQHEEKSWFRNEILHAASLPAGGQPEIQNRADLSSSQHQIACPSLKINPEKPDFDLSNLTYTLTDLSWDGDQGIWDDEMEANYRRNSQKNPTNNGSDQPLLVYIVPFSHADPGWLSTIEEYFQTSIKMVLDNMLKRLKEWPDMTFIWAETSYFKMWWETLDEAKKGDVRSLTKSGRLEIVNGGYVMPDEANCNYYAILHQYIYGHQWLLENVGVIPEHGFSIDPFGHSSSMPYFLKNLDFKTIFIQRIHYNLRKYLGREKATEFLWQQPWDSAAANSIFTHLAPHHLYTIKNICGLTQGRCYFFDFKDIMYEIEKTQIENQAKILLEEIRKTASIYPHNVLLYILGDDFRWAEDSEWTNQYRNYKQLMQVINSNQSNHVNIKFGTLKNYYDSVFGRMGEPVKRTPTLPSVQGDFFPYADKFQDYWTGYFTSRPFYKQMSRELERDLRTAEILLVLAKTETSGKDADFREDLIGLERAAQSLALFQHHDAITGTSKRLVALDYGDKLQNGLLMAHAVILKNLFRLAKIASHSDQAKANIILETYRPTSTALPAKSPLFFGLHNMQRTVFLFNPLLRSRKSLIHLFSETPNLLITDPDGTEIPYQVSPALNDVDTKGFFLDVVRITFFLQLDPLALKAISIGSLGERSKKILIKSRFPTTVRTSDLAGEKGNIPGFSVKALSSETDVVVLSNGFMSATFRADNGMLQTVTTKNGNRQVAMELKRYETISSGAYLFRPSGLGDIMPYPYTVRVLEGPFFSEIQTLTSGIVLTVRIYNSTCDLGKSLEIELITEMNDMGSQNSELVLRFSTDIHNNMTFYTDSNGFQTMQRRVSHVLPMAANYYPATSMAFLQDSKTRLTLHLNQAHGVGSQRSGELEVMIDRFLMQDDGRGVGEALQDVRTVKSQIQLQLETEGFCTDCLYKNPTDTATKINLATNHPPYVTFEQAKSNLTIFNYKPVKELPPCDVHLLMMKPVTYNLNDRRVGFLFHRLGMDCASLHTDPNVCIPGKEQLFLSSLFQKGNFKSYNETNLNFINLRKELAATTPVPLEPMTIAAVTAFLP